VEFTPFPQVPRLSREIVNTEKIDGTNASVYVADPGVYCAGLFDEGPLVAKVGGCRIMAGSRTRWVTPADDNYGFAAWVRDNAEELALLGPGHHFGEWWGRGIQRGYGLEERRFSLFNVGRWKNPHTVSMKNATEDDFPPFCCHVVPVLFRGLDPYNYSVIAALNTLEMSGSRAAPGFMDPEGVMVYHTASNQNFKKTIKGDEEGKHAEAHPPKPKVERPPRDHSKGGRRASPPGLGYAGPWRRSTDKKEVDTIS
jgi:hypothetical protein